MKAAQLAAHGDDRPFIENIKVRRVTVKEGVHFRVWVESVSETVDFSLIIWDPKEEKHEVFVVGSVIDLQALYPDRDDDVDSFLVKEGEEPGSDMSIFDPVAVAQLIMDRSELTLEGAGFKLNVYIELGTFREMVEIERSEAETYVKFKSA
jgi:hypothetical protein